MSAPKSQPAKHAQEAKSKKKPAPGSGGDATHKPKSAARAAAANVVEPVVDGSEDDRTLPTAGPATRTPNSATDRARDERLVKELEGNAAGSVADRHRQGLTATENEEDDLPQDLDEEPVDGLAEPIAPGAEDADLAGAVTQERAQGLDPDYRDGRRRNAGGRAAKDT